MRSSVLGPRASGLLLHPTSLPGPFGVGDLGPQAHAFAAALARAGQSWWQVLPLGPTGYGDSPYQCFSAFAGNPLLVSPERLVEEGLLSPAELGPPLPEGRADYERAIPEKGRLLRLAFGRLEAGAAPRLRQELAAFAEAESAWLDDFALFLALKAAHRGAPWTAWEPTLAARRPEALAAARARLSAEVGLHRFAQLLFFRQWRELKARARALGVGILGDAPIFVAHDSADVWAHRELFRLDAAGRPEAVAGVPPDYFSATGQLWGNPLYDWSASAATGHAWWIERLGAAHRLFDLVRLDHFIGFVRYWAVPAGAPTAAGGAWREGPGADLFDAAEAALGPLAIVAEDLGAVTPAVEALRLRYGFPGMRVLQFAFAGAVEPRFLPHRHERSAVVYTGTHDNDTTRAWYAGANPADRARLTRYLGRPCPEAEASWELLRLAWASVADLAVAPVQDVLSLGAEARMNLPGSPTGNWRWRLRPGEPGEALLERLAALGETYERAPHRAGPTA